MKLNKIDEFRNRVSFWFVVIQKFYNHGNVTCRCFTYHRKFKEIPLSTRLVQLKLRSNTCIWTSQISSSSVLFLFRSRSNRYRYYVMACLWFPPFHVTVWNIALPLNFHNLRWWKPILPHKHTPLLNAVKRPSLSSSKGRHALASIKGKARVLSLTWLGAVHRYIWAERMRLSPHKSTFDGQNIRPSPALLWRLNLFPVQYVWLTTLD